jgi:hypothetical protein
MTVTAINTKATDMMLVAERHRLNDNDMRPSRAVTARLPMTVAAAAG